MKSLQEIENILNQVKILVNSYDNTDIKLNANGGNSILLVCNPEDENEFIQAIHNNMEADKFELIDVNKELIEYIKQNKAELIEKFELLQTSIQQIFKSPEEENDNSFFSYLISKIRNSFNDGKVPLLYSVGCLYGTRIDNIQLLENKLVINSRIPLVILYPATETKDSLLFLNSRPASKYRCMIIK